MILHWSEYLPRISSVNLLLEIDTNDSFKSLTKISADTMLATLYSGETAEIKVPYKILSVPQKVAHEEKTEQGTQLLHFRVSTVKQENLEEKFNLLMTDTVIWNKSDLMMFDPFVFSCAGCHGLLMHGAKVRQVNDAPSDSWAEMMDFWHCHKPSSDAKDGFKLKFNELKPASESIIVGNYFLLVNMGDFNLGTRCPCGNELGVEGRNNTLKIFKWNILLNDKMKYHPYYHAYNVLLDNINMNASRFYRMVHENSGNDKSESLVLWVFNFGLSITLSQSDHIYDNCMKVMFYEGNDEPFDTVEVPEIVLNDLKRELKKVNLALPPTLRKMQQWNVSYLYV